MSVKRLAMLYILGLVTRCGYGLVAGTLSPGGSGLIFPDEQQYWMVGQSVRAGALMTDELGHHATRMPLFPGLIAQFPDSDGGVVAFRLLLCVIGAGVVPLVMWLGYRCGGPAVGIIAGVMAAIDPLLVGFSSLVLTEAPYAVAAAALWIAGWPMMVDSDRVSWRRVVCVAALSALAVYVRPSGVVLVTLLVVMSVLRRRVAIRALLQGIAVVGLVIGSLIPWAARNQRVTGDWCWLTHRAGISLYDGVRPGADGASDLGDIKAMPAVAKLDEVAWDRYFKDASWEQIRSDPGRVVRLAIVKLGRTWSPLLHASEAGGSTRMLIAGWTVVCFALATAGVWWHRGRPWMCAALLLPALHVSILHSLYVGSVRYRTPAMPALLVLAALGCVGLWRAMRDREQATDIAAR